MSYFLRSRVLARLAKEWREEDHPRVPAGSPDGGQFTSAAAAVSPWDKDSMPVPDSERQIGKFLTKRLDIVSRLVNRKMGLDAKVDRAVGAWQDGDVVATEPSVFMRFDKAKYEDVKAAASMLGMLTRQKAVLTFQSDPNGPDALYEFTLPMGATKSNEFLSSHGVTAHTLIPSGDKTQVVVYAHGNEHSNAMPSIAGKASDFKWRRGRGEFIGIQWEEYEGRDDTQQRDLARTRYEEQIGASPSGAAASRGWFRDLRDRWGRSEAALKADLDAFEAEEGRPVTGRP